MYGLVRYSTCEPEFGVVIYIFNALTGARISFLPKNRSSVFLLCVLNVLDSVIVIPSMTIRTRSIRFFYFENHKRGVQVYILGDGSGWRDKPEVTYQFKESGVFANGALHWIANTTRSERHTVAFDLAAGTFQTIGSLRGFRSYSSISVTLERDLCLCLYEEQGEIMMEVWVFRKKNINNCRRRLRLKARTYVNSFTWIKVLSG